MQLPEGTPTVQISLSFYELAKLEILLVNSHMFNALNEADLEQTMALCPFLAVVRSQKEAVRLKEIERLINFPQHPLRKQVLALFRGVEQKNEDTIFMSYHLFKQNRILDRFRDVAKFELRHEASKVHKLALKYLA